MLSSSLAVICKGKMMRSAKNAVSSHSGLIPFETVYEKRGGLLWSIARKKNLVSLRLAALFTIFVCNLVHAYKFHDSMFIEPLNIKKN